MRREHLCPPRPLQPYRVTCTAGLTESFDRDIPREDFLVFLLSFSFSATLFWSFHPPPLPFLPVLVNSLYPYYPLSLPTPPQFYFLSSFPLFFHLLLLFLLVLLLPSHHRVTGASSHPTWLLHSSNLVPAGPQDMLLQFCPSVSLSVTWIPHDSFRKDLMVFFFL